MQDVAPDRTADVEPGRKRGGEEVLTTDVEQDLEPGHRATDGQGVEPISRCELVGLRQLNTAKRRCLGRAIRQPDWQWKRRL